MPMKWMDTWRKKNPDMEYCLWVDYHDFRYEDKIDKLVAEGRYACAVDIMRVEILEKEGGVYIDADSVCLEPIQDAPFMDTQFFAAWDYTNLVANGVIGCTAGHPAIREYLERIANFDEYWEFGARLLTKCLHYRDISILPTCTFYPKSQKGRVAPLDGKVYAEQFWATTKGLYASADL